MNITPDMWPADTEALRTRITRLEAQSETRRLQTLYWQERAQGFEAERDWWMWTAEHNANLAQRALGTRVRAPKPSRRALDVSPD